MSKEESAYRAAKKKLETAQNLGGGLTAETKDPVWLAALDALVEVGDYEDAPALADEAREYFYVNALWWFWQIDDHEDALTQAQAYLDAVPNYRDAADWTALREALAHFTDGKVAEAAEIVRTLPESFNDNPYRLAILIADACQEENWTEALDFAQALEPLIIDDGNGNEWLTRKYCTETILRCSGLEMFANAMHDKFVFQGFLLCYYTQQTDLGNDITTLEDCPCELTSRGFAKTPLGEVNLRDIYWDRAHRMEESLEQYGIAEDYAKLGTYRTKYSPVRKDEIEIMDGRVPTPPAEITGSGICFLEKSNYYDGVKVGVNDFRYRVAPLCLADSVESARYVCRFYHNATKTHRVRSSDGYEGGMSICDTTVQLIDMVTGETLAVCQYHESECDEVLNEKLVPVLRELVTVY
ncbi:MAG: hypothetical protein IJI45_15870 [Anaerolineaceae bacterium]|nr:hypothetical protein [Anaerolineaceae bacterium]